MVQGISSIDDRKGYIVVMRIDQTLIIEGERYSPRIVGYPPGFSLIGIPSITENTSSDLFSSLNSSLIRVYSMNTTLIQNDPLLLDYMNYTVLTGTGALQIIIPDMGLWFYANDTGSIDVTW